MAIVVSCQCGKRFQAKDESAGKRAKCPGCGAILVIGAGAPTAAAVASPAPLAPASAAPQAATADPALDPPSLDVPAAVESPAPLPPVMASPAPMPAPTSAAPAARGSAVSSTGFLLPKRFGSPQSGRQPSLHISGGIIALVAAAILIPAIVIGVIKGPAKAAQEWQKLEPEAEGEIKALAQQFLEDLLTDHGKAEMPATMLPSVRDIVMTQPGVMLWLPEEIPFGGRSSEGSIRGVYHTRTRQIEAGIMALGQIHKVKGHCKENGQVVFDP